MVRFTDTQRTRRRERPPLAVIWGGLMLPLGAGLAFAAALLAFGFGIGNATGGAAFFGALAALALLVAVVGIVFLAVGSVWWAVRLRRSGTHKKFSKTIVVTLLMWAAAIVTGIAVSAGLGTLRFIGYGLMIASFSLWLLGALLLAISSYLETRGERQRWRKVRDQA